MVVVFNLVKLLTGSCRRVGVDLTAECDRVGRGRRVCEVSSRLVEKPSFESLSCGWE